MISPRKGSKVRLSIYAAITFLALANTIRHMIEQTRWIDWLMLVIEAAVLLLIAYEVGVNWYRHSAEVKQQKLRNTIVAKLSDFMFKGQSIRDSVPAPHQTGDNITQWIGRTDEWRSEVSQYLSKVSSRAGAAFSLVIASQSDGRILHNSGEGTFYVAGLLANAYVPLVSYLNNLRGIIEKPEAYF